MDLLSVLCHKGQRASTFDYGQTWLATFAYMNQHWHRAGERHGLMERPHCVTFHTPPGPPHTASRTPCHWSKTGMIACSSATQIDKMPELTIRTTPNLQFSQIFINKSRLSSNPGPRSRTTSLASSGTCSPSMASDSVDHF